MQHFCFFLSTFILAFSNCWLFLAVSAVNNTSELGPVQVMTFLANETTITLSNLNSSMLYKFYLSAKTNMGSGPIITEEAFTVMHTSESCVQELEV